MDLLFIQYFWTCLKDITAETNPSFLLIWRVWLGPLLGTAKCASIKQVIELWISTETVSTNWRINWYLQMIVICSFAVYWNSKINSLTLTMKLKVNVNKMEKSVECHRLISSQHQGLCHRSHSEQITKAIWTEGKANRETNVGGWEQEAEYWRGWKRMWFCVSYFRFVLFSPQKSFLEVAWKVNQNRNTVWAHIRVFQQASVAMR